MKTPIHHRSPDLNSGCGLLFKRRERGFSLVELLVVVTIMVVLVAVAMPNLAQLVTSMRIKNASFDVYASIVAARSEAITRNATVTITPVSGDWAAGWNVTAPAPSGTVTLKTQNAFPSITITGPATLVYQSSGRLAAAVTSIKLTATGAPDVVGRCITMDLSGRPVTTKPTGGVCP